MKQSDTPTIAPTAAPVRVFDVSHAVAQLLASAWILEDNGDVCEIRFERNARGRIVGVGLYAEAK